LKKKILGIRRVLVPAIKGLNWKKLKTMHECCLSMSTLTCVKCKEWMKTKKKFCVFNFNEMLVILYVKNISKLLGIMEIFVLYWIFNK
jgi:hypothetical protein